ncbi:MAG: hypothetical protein WD249_04240 [Gaiellaceae bacterium]
MGLLKSAGAIFILIVVAVAIFGGDDDDDSGSGEPAAAEAAAVETPSGGADIVLVKKQSWCLATGIDDLYTGDGHVTFYLTLRNRGTEAGEVTVTPIRYYDDGNDNRSPLDAVTVDVAAGEVWKGRTSAMKYKAHEHEIVSCAAQIDSRPEVEISMIG